MNQVVVTALLTGGFTLAAALSTTIVSQRNAVRLAREAREEARRDSNRQVITELLLAGRDWIALLEVLVPGYAKFESSDLIEFVKSDSATTHGENSRRFDRTLIDARLRIGHEGMGQLLSELAARKHNAPQEIVGPLMPSSPDRGMEVIGESLKKVWAISALLDDVEGLAAPLLKQPEEARVSGRRLRRLFRVGRAI